jgi:hypothetical protein
METVKKKNIEKSEKKNDAALQKKKSAFTLFWEKYPNGVGEIVDMRAVLNPGLDEAIEDVKNNRVYKAKNAKDLISQCLK